jgi:hypothetical protein
MLKFLQEGTGNTLEVIGIGNDFLNRTPTAQQLRERMDKWDIIKLKSFCTTKEMVSRLKRPPTDKGLITRIYRELKLNSPKINEPIKKWATELNRTFSKEEIQMVRKTHEKMLTISNHKGNAIKITLRFHLTPTGVGKDVRNKEPWYTADRNTSWCNHSGNKFGAFLKIKT